jgi:hypothetical protein
MLSQIQSLLSDADRSLLEVISHTPLEERSGHLCRTFIKLRAAQNKLDATIKNLHREFNRRHIYENPRTIETR